MLLMYSNFAKNAYGGTALIESHTTNELAGVGGDIYTQPPNNLADDPDIFSLH